MRDFSINYAFFDLETSAAHREQRALERKGRERIFVENRFGHAREQASASFSLSHSRSRLACKYIYMYIQDYIPIAMHRLYDASSQARRCDYFFPVIYSDRLTTTFARARARTAEEVKFSRV